jgi:hypothetical protein
MTHVRYWAMSLATGVCGAFIAIDKFAFEPDSAVWIAFGVAAAAIVFSLGAFGVALLRENHAFSGLSALNVLVGTWTVIGVLVFSKPTGLWQAFAGGIVMLLVSLRALALHETTIERVVHALGLGAAPESALASGPTERGRMSSLAPDRLSDAATSLARRLEVSAPMRSWMYWLTNTALALAGAFVVLMTFAMTTAGSHHTSPRWIAFGIGIAATCAAVGALIERGFTREAAPERTDNARLAAVAMGAAAAAVSIAMIVTMVVYSGTTARWIAFALGCGLAGVSLLASAIHEFTSERVRHELELAEPAHRQQPAVPTMPAA